MDWTYSPYVALFFAIAENYGGEPDTRSVYCPKMNKIQQDERYTEPEEGVSFIPVTGFGSLSFYSPLTDENPRLISQAGLFTVSRNEKNIKQWVATHYPDRKGYDKWILLQINVDTDKHERVRILKKLNRMNINHATLFPDIEGAAKYAIMQLSIKGY